MKKNAFGPGQIWHPRRKRETIAKVMEFEEAEVYDEQGNGQPVHMYMLTREFPKYHYVIIDEIVDNYLHPEHPHAVAYLITHSSSFNNLKVTDDLYIHSLIDLKDSYVTRDKFLIHVNDLGTMPYGIFNIDRLRKSLSDF